MDSTEILMKIAKHLIGIAYDNLSTAEKNIVNILCANKILSFDENAQVTWFCMPDAL